MTCGALNDSGKPFLYPPAIFEVLDPSEPADWVVKTGRGGERYAYPPSLNTGLFEDFFDDDPRAVARFWRVVNDYMSASFRS